MGLRGLTSILCSLSTSAALILVCPTASEAQSKGALFERVSGAWAGSGEAEVAGGQPERLRCRVDYSPYGPAQLHLSLRCATDSFTLQVASDLERHGEAITGTWTETSMGLSGNVSGALGSDGFRATVSALGTSAELSMTVRGNVQSFVIVSQGQFSARATVLMRRV